MISIPRSNKKWITSFKGEDLGNIVSSFGLDLFSSPGRVKAGGKIYPNTTGTLSGSPITPVADFITASISDGSNRVSKVWGVAADKLIVRSENNAPFVKDNSTNFASNENTGLMSDIMSVGDGTGDAIAVTQMSVARGSNKMLINGVGATVKWAQSFTNVEGPFKKLSFYARHVGERLVGSNLIIEIQSDSSGLPSGTVLSSLTIPWTDLTANFQLYEYENTDWTVSTLEFTLNTKYWFVFRTDDTSGDDYTQILMQYVPTTSTDVDDPNNPYKYGELIQNNGSNWSARTLTYRRQEAFANNSTWTPPAGVTDIRVEAWGAGGGGTTNVGGGGGGAYARSNLSGISNTSKTIVVGRSGNNLNGGASSYDNTVVVAAGGLSGANGGTAGTTANSTGGTLRRGGYGSTGTGNRGGGGGAGNSTSGTSTSGQGSNASGANSGDGGNNTGGSGGGYFTALSAMTNGGFLFGGGGSSTSANGFPGGRGQVLISYEIAKSDDYPSVLLRSSGRDSYSVSPTVGPAIQAYNLPDQALPGDLLLLVLTTNGADFSVTENWTLLASAISADAKCRKKIYYKRHDGDEKFEVEFASAGNNASPGAAYTYALYWVLNGDTPTASITPIDPGASVKPPEHDAGDKVGNYLSLITGAFYTNGAISDNTDDEPDAIPDGYDNFVLQTEFANLGSSGNNPMSPRLFLADKQEYVRVVNPETFGATSVTGGGVTATVAIPYLEQRAWQDASVALQVEFPAAPERLYVSTTKDVRFLDKDDGKWYSLWIGILGQDPLEEAYPHPMKYASAGGLIFLGDGNKLHSFIATANNATEANANRLVFDDTHYISWIQTTKSALFIGLTNKQSEVLPGYVVYYEPQSQLTRIFTIEEGATVGWIKDENCQILDKSGQIRVYTGTAFAVIDYFPPYFQQLKINKLPHRNGIVAKDNQVQFLWEGQYPWPAGIWAYEDGRLYHKHPLIFDPTSLNSFGAIDVPTGWGALYDISDNTYAGASVYGSDNVTAVSGVFSNFKTTGVTVSDSKRSYSKTPRFGSQQRDNIWQRVFAKIDYRPAGLVEGSVVLKYRQEAPDIGEGIYASSFSGTWTSPTTFTTTDAGFRTAVDNGYILPDHEVIIRRGNGAGLKSQIQSITGTTTRTVTLKEGLTAVTSGAMNFSVENWKVITNKDLVSKPSEWLQVQMEVRDRVELEELQVTFDTNETNQE